jgi:hypothetical protein
MTLAVNIAQGGSNNVTMRNRIINGAFMVSQYYGTGTVTPSAAGSTFVIDRFNANISQASAILKWGQNLNGITPPPGFSYYLGCQVNTTATCGTNDYFNFMHRMEGLNVSDLGWGTANAKSVTLSFWVYTNLAGTYSFAFNSSGASYSSLFTVTTANTWQQITITVPGPTIGTFATNNTLSFQCVWSLSSGSGLTGAPGSWQATSFYGANGALTNFTSSTSNVFYITGVQLEAGTTASPFEYRQYGTELALCQRYYLQYYGFNNAGAQYMRDTAFFKVSMRAAPTLSVYASTPGGSGTGTVNKIYQGSGETAASTSNGTTETGRIDSSGYTSNVDIYYLVKANAEL